MAYVIIENGIVVQKQPYDQEGFIEAPDHVVCGWLYDGSAFSAPTPADDNQPDPVAKPPQITACALRVPIIDGEVQQVGGAYRIAAMMLLDTGTFLAVFTEDLGPAEPFLVPNNGVSVSISEWGGGYAIIEIRDHAGGTLLTPASFGFSLYNF